MKMDAKTIRKSCAAMGAALLAAAQWSCSREIVGPQEVFNPESYIGFGLPAVRMGGPEICDMETRATKYDAFPDGGTFGVLGYCKSASDNNDATAAWATKYQLLTHDVFDKQSVTCSGGACSYTNLKQWYTEPDNSPTPYLYTFFAYYPADGGFSLAYTGQGETGAPRLTYTMPFSGTDQALDNDAAVDAMVAVKYNHPKAMGNVDFGFSHLMTAIRFRVNNYDDDTPVRIYSVKLNGNFYRSTTLDYSPVAQQNHVQRTTTDTYGGTYTFYDDAANPMVVPYDSSLPVGDGGGTMVLLLPGIETDNDTVKGLGSDVGFTCDFEFLNGKQMTRSVNLNDYAFESGTLYTVNLNFIGDSFTVNITSDNWENGSDNDIVIQ